MSLISYLPVLLETLGEELLLQPAGLLWVVQSEDLSEVPQAQAVVLLGNAHLQLHVDPLHLHVEADAEELRISSVHFYILIFKFQKN